MFKAEHRGRVARLTMQREPVNAINNEWIAGFNRVLDHRPGHQRQRWPDDGGLNAVIRP